MKKTLLYFMLLTCLATNAQNIIFQDNFDSYANFDKTDVGPWTLTDVDLRPTYGFGGGTTFPGTGTTMAFIVFNSTAVTPALTPGAASNWTARSGQKAMACIASVPNAAFPTNDDWLISPAIILGGADNLLSFWAKSCDNEFFDEQFEVAISTTGTAISDFTIISSGATVFGPYEEFTYALDAFNGQTIYVGIHCISPDQFGFMLDDFKVTTSDLAVNQSLNSKFSTYPNPVSSIVNLTNDNNIAVSNITINDINGRTVKTVNTNTLSTIQINVSDLSAGVYLMNITSESGNAVKKFIKS